MNIRYCILEASKLSVSAGENFSGTEFPLLIIAYWCFSGKVVASLDEHRIMCLLSFRCWDKLTTDNKREQTALTVGKNIEVIHGKSFLVCDILHINDLRVEAARNTAAQTYHTTQRHGIKMLPGGKTSLVP